MFTQIAAHGNQPTYLPSLLLFLLSFLVKGWCSIHGAMAHCSVTLFHVSSLHLLWLYSTHFTLKQPRNIWSVCFCKSYWQASAIMKFGKRLFTKIDYKYCRNLSTQKNGLFILTNNQLLCHFLLVGWLQSQDMKMMLNLKFSCCCLLLLSCSQLASWHRHVFLHFTLAVSLGGAMEVCTAFSYSWGDWVQHFA